MEDIAIFHVWLKEQMLVHENRETEEMLINIAYGHKIMRTVYVPW